MTENMTLNWKRVDAIVERMNGVLNNADKEFEKLNNLVLEDLGHFEKLIEDPDQLKRDEAIDAMMVDLVECAGVEFSFGPEPDESEQDPIRKEEISYLNEKDGPGLADQEPQNSLLKKEQENLKELKQTADTKFESVLQSLETAETDAKTRMLYQKEKRERVQKNLSHFQKLLEGFIKDQQTQSGVQSSTPNYVCEPQIQIQIH